MSLREHSRPLEDLRMLLQGEDDLVLVVEGVADKKFWQTCIENYKSSLGGKSVRIKNVDGKNNLKKAATNFSHSHVRFVYDRDYDPLIKDNRAIPYPATDLESFLLGDPAEFTTDSIRYSIFTRQFRIGLDPESNSNKSGNLFLEDYQAAWNLASVWGSLKKVNQDLSLRIGFDDHKLLFQIIKKSKPFPPSKSAFETQIANAIRNSLQREGQKEIDLAKRGGVPPSGKDVLWIFSFGSQSLFLTSDGRNKEQGMLNCAEVLVKSLLYSNYPQGDPVAEFAIFVLSASSDRVIPQEGFRL